MSLQLDRHGWLLATNETVLLARSPNFNTRPASIQPYLLVIHNISLPPNQFSGSAVIDFFQNKLDFDSHPWFEHIRDVTVSAHFFIRRNGQIVQFVSTDDRAWHAGISCYAGQENCNDFSIGIELEGADTIAYCEIQYERLSQLTRTLSQRYPIKAIQGHEHIAPARKTDPGPAFDWHYYAQLSQLPWRYFPLAK